LASKVEKMLIVFNRM